MTHKNIRKPKIKTIIFDIGGVQYFYDHRISAKPMSKILGVPENKIFEIIAKDRQFIESCEKSNPPKVYWGLLAKKLKIKKVPIKELTLIWNKVFSPNKKILKLLPKLKKNYKLGLISNISIGHKKFLVSKYSIKKPFNTTIFSCDHNIRKPNPKIFKLALKKLNIRPKEAIFIDDFPSNVKGAKKLGINGICYKNHKQFLKELKKLGVEVK